MAVTLQGHTVRWLDPGSWIFLGFWNPVARLHRNKESVNQSAETSCKNDIPERNPSPRSWKPLSRNAESVHTQQGSRAESRARVREPEGDFAHDIIMIKSLSRRWTLSKSAAAAAVALVAMVAGMPGANAMFSSSSDVVQASSVYQSTAERVQTGEANGNA